MAPPTGFGTRVARGATLCVAFALFALASRPASAGPELAAGVGAATASSDPPDAAGFSLWGAALWPLTPRLKLGPMLFADEHGSETGRLLDPNDGTDLGATARDHRTRFGGGWRLEVPFTWGPRWESSVGGAWSYYRVHDDRLGVVRRAFSATGASVGLGISRRMWSGARLGGSVRVHRLIDDRQDHYVTATVDWTWRPAPDASARRAAGTPPTEGN